MKNIKSLVKNNDQVLLEECVTNPQFNPNQIVEGGYPIIVVAMAYDNSQLFDCLMDNIKFDPNFLSLSGKSPLMYAVEFNSSKYFKKLLKHPLIDIGKKDIFGNTLKEFIVFRTDLNLVSQEMNDMNNELNKSNKVLIKTVV